MTFSVISDKINIMKINILSAVGALFYCGRSYEQYVKYELDTDFLLQYSACICKGATNKKGDMKLMKNNIK